MSLNEQNVKRIMYRTGLTYGDSYELLYEYNGDVDSALDYIESLSKYLSGSTLAKENINTSIKNIGVYNKLCENLSKYNTKRGGKNFKGYVFEELHAADATINGQITEVIGNNGSADFKMIGKDGKVSYGQAKVNYKKNKNSVKWDKYKDQTIVVDKGNEVLKNSAQKAGCKEVIESNISEKEAISLAKKMQLESKVTGKTNATIAPKLHATGKIAKQCHSAGVKSAKSGAVFGAGFSIGSNIV